MAESSAVDELLSELLMTEQFVTLRYNALPWSLRFRLLLIITVVTVKVDVDKLFQSIVE